MAMKEWFRQLQPVQLYVILVLSVIFFVAELTLSHITHALTLLMDSYQTLCNIIALTGCLVTLKHGKNMMMTCKDEKTTVKVEDSVAANSTIECAAKEPINFNSKKKSVTAVTQESKLKNTFGWARIDVMTMLICCVFLASLLFSLLVEAVQTLVHIDHNDEMHQPVLVFITGCFGLILNGICYVLIGGFTFHQGSFLYVTESGDVVLDKVVTSDSIKKGERRLSRTRTVPTPQYRQRQGAWEILRDCIGCIFVVLCSVLIYFSEKEIAKYIDPILSICSAAILMVLSYPYMKESCLILLQTIPGSIDIDILKKHLLEHFPDIVNVHDFHVWQLTASKVISTVHIHFQNPDVYAKIIDQIRDFFTEYGITQVTIQPEFGSRNSDGRMVKASCLMQCQSEGCRPCHCCPDLLEINNIMNSTNSKFKEEIPSISEEPILKSIRIIGGETSKPVLILNKDVDETVNGDNNEKTAEESPVCDEEKVLETRLIEQH